MHTLRTQILVLAGLVVAFIGVSFFISNVSAAVQKPAQPIQVKWLLSHNPTSVFKRASVVFADELAKESGGQMILSVVTPSDIGWNSGDIPNTEVFKYLDSGQVQLATTYTVGLGKEAPAFWSINLPFLFGSYAEADAILDGGAGRQILDTAGINTTAHALAFTMSGGFRIIVSPNTAIKTPADMKGLHIATSGGPVAEATLSALGAVPVPTDLENGAPSIDAKTIDGIETTYSRLAVVVGSQTQYTKYISETNHSLFLTAILAGNAFYDSLSPQNQLALRKAALAAARVEREDSIALGEQTKEALRKQGSTIVTLTPADVSVMHNNLQSVYAKFTPMFGEELIGGLRGQ